MNKNIILFLLLNTWFGLFSQVNYTDYQNPFPQTYLVLNNYGYAAMGNDESSVYMIGKMQVLGQERGFIFTKKNDNTNNSYKVYYCNPQTSLSSISILSSLKHYFAFQNTDSDIGCSSGGLKIMKLDKLNLSVTDSVFFCDPTKPSSGQGYFMYNHFYTHSAYEQYYPPPLPANYIKRWNLIRRIDTNLVMLNEQILGDTSEVFGIYTMREGCDGGIMVNAINETIIIGGPMLLKLDTMGVEQWRKIYYQYAQSGCGTNAGNGIMGLQNYQNGYVALFNLSNCSNYLYSQSIIAKIDKNGNLVKEVQYTTAGDTTLEFYSNFTNYTKRTKFYNILIKTNDGNFASVISEREKYGFNQHENYIVLLDTNLNIIHRSPPLGSLYAFDSPGMVQGADSVFYLGGGVMNSTNDGMNVRIYSYKIGGQVGVMEYTNEKQFKIYPNPAINELNIELDEVPQLISIHNSMGQLVYKQTHNGTITVDVSNWSKGVYFVEVHNTKINAKQSQKFIVE